MTDFNSKLLVLLWSFTFLLACNSDTPTPSASTVADEKPASTSPLSATVAEEEMTDSTAKLSPAATAAVEKVAETPAESPEVEAPKPEKTEPPKKPKKRPKIAFTTTSYDYGIIMQGDKVEHSFKFKNTGKADLMVKNVTASCGCTQPSYPFIPIAPGDEGVIGVVFDSKGKLGRQKPTITVVTNARPSTYKLYLEGFVDAERAEDQSESKEESTPKQESEEGGL